MDIVVILAPIAVALGGVFAWMFVRAATTGQFDDLDDPPIRILHDDPPE